MTKLFIIGNGFDLAHGMKTRYSDFRDYLIDEYDVDENLINKDIYDISTSHDLLNRGRK